MKWRVQETARSTSPALVTLAETKTRLGVSGSGEDSTLAALITIASSLCASYVGRPLVFATWEELGTHQFGDVDRRQLYLSRFPIDASSIAVTIEGEDKTSEVTVLDHAEGLLWRPSGWPCAIPVDSAGVNGLKITYRAGWLGPDLVSDWAASTAYSAGAWVRPSTSESTPFLMECTTGGTTDSSEPTWPTTVDGTVTDNSVVWTARRVSEVPRDVQHAAYLAVRGLRDDRPGGLTSWREGPFGETFSQDEAESQLPANSRRVLDCYRRPWR